MHIIPITAARCAGAFFCLNEKSWFCHFSDRWLKPEHEFRPAHLYLQDIHLTYGVTPLLEGADLSVGRGARLCLVGRNGSGKSTLLRIAAGLTDADSGERFVQPGIFVPILRKPDFSGFRPPAIMCCKA